MSQIVAGDREGIAATIATTTYRRFDAQIIYTSRTKRGLALFAFPPEGPCSTIAPMIKEEQHPRRIAAVTGASGAIGLAIARQLNARNRCPKAKQ